MPVTSLVTGKSREAVAELMPRLFNLCREAQGAAVRLALGLPGASDATALRQEILRDHVLRLSVVLPGHFGQSAPPLPRGWQSGGLPLRKVLFGRTARLPETPYDYKSYLAAGDGIAGLWSRLADMFAKGEAASSLLPFVTPSTALDATACVENSCALRVARHPVLAHLEETQGRGPLWRVVARSYDLQAVLDGVPLLSLTSGAGTAHVPATRGLYSVNATAENETVTAFTRVTPTDHLRAKGGVLDQTLARLPVTRAGLAPLVLDILDPCSPIRIKEVADA